MQCGNLAKDFSRYFDVLYAGTEELKKAVFKIRYDVFCEELQLEKGCPKDIERDEFDSYSHHFLLRHKPTEEYAGTVRFVIPPPDKLHLVLPFEKFCAHSIDSSIVDISKLRHGSYGEVSRLAVPARFRKRAGEAGRPYIIDSHKQNGGAQDQRLFPYISVGLYLTSAALFVLRQLDYAFVMAEPRLARSMSRIGIRFEKAGKVIEYHGRRAPFYITQSILKNNLKPEIMELFDYLKNEVEVQLVNTLLCDAV